LPVQPLGLPDRADEASPEALLETPAVALFVARARAVRPDFGLTPENGPAVAALCRRLDGLPLAIELAAARVDLFSPDVMLDRLERHLPIPMTAAEDAPARHRTLDAAVGWGYAQLQPSEQALFRRLAVLSGAWTVNAAEAVGDMASLGLDGLTALITLADKGLLQASGAESGEVRFTMLETIRAAALQQLESSGEVSETRRRHEVWSSLHGGRGTASSSHHCSPNGAPTPRPVVSPLSERERDVLRLVAEGLPSKQIGRELGLAERTVKAHVTGAMNKLGAFSRAQALGIAVERHYL
jgi:DNA-binding CsgD family transcriptional regulator